MSALVQTIRALLQVLAEAGITCRFQSIGGCESWAGEPCEMCAARDALAKAEGRS